MRLSNIYSNVKKTRLLINEFFTLNKQNDDYGENNTSECQFPTSLLK